MGIRLTYAQQNTITKYANGDDVDVVSVGHGIVAVSTREYVRLVLEDGDIVAEKRLQPRLSGSFRPGERSAEA